MADELVKRKRTRAGHKGSATKMIRKIEVELSKTPLDREELAALKLTLSEKLETIKTLDAAVIDLIEEENVLATEIEQADDYKVELYKVLGKIDEDSPDSSSAAPISAPTPTSSSSRVRLLKLQLQSFSGDLTKWTSFWQSFESAVHKNSDLSDIEKFNYLKSLLERSAREAVAGLALTDANYHQAVETLQK